MLRRVGTTSLKSLQRRCVISLFLGCKLTTSRALQIKPLTEEEKKQKLAELREKMTAKRAAKAKEDEKEAEISAIQKAKVALEKDKETLAELVKRLAVRVLPCSPVSSSPSPRLSLTREVGLRASSDRITARD